MNRQRKYTAVETANMIINEESSSDESVANSNGSEEEDNVISESDDEENSEDGENNEVHIPEAAQHYRSKNGAEQWSHVPNNHQGQARAHNIINQRAGPSRYAAQTCGESPLVAFKLFITEEMMRLIVTNTNNEGRLQFPGNWVDTTVDEMYKFVGLLLLTGVFRDKN